jgi:hypothetical protein
MKKPFSFLGLILAILFGPGAVNRIGTAAPVHRAPSTTETHPHKDKEKAAPGVTALTGGEVECTTISPKDLERRWWLVRTASGCSVAVSQAWKEICKINPNTYSEDDALARNLSGPEFKKKCLGDPASVQSMMAAVPNPRRTHLGLMTDRAIEAIQVAASEAGFMPLAHYLPWPEGTSGGGDASSDTKSQADSTVPGVLVFQSNASDLPLKPKYLLVFLIPETPTEGLDRIVFKTAGAMIREISPSQDNKIRFVGPNFSGSVAALEEMQQTLGDGAPEIEAVSGSVTNQENIPKGLVTFTPIQTSDREALCRFVKGVESFGYERNEIAILSEEGTQYGRQSPSENPRTLAREGLPSQSRNAGSRNEKSDPCNENRGKKKSDSEKGAWEQLWFLHFPREISKLRNAYGVEVGKRAPAGSGSSSDLGLQWQDTEGTNRDDVLTYGGQQTPLSQEAVLSTLSITLKARGIKALEILATDPMDEAFLIHSIKRSSPDVRLFLRDPDLLFLRTPDVGSLNGTLLVSNFPLVPENQFWSAAGHGSKTDNDTKKANSTAILADGESAISAAVKDNHHLISFPSAFQEGEYNAFVELLRDANWAPPDMQRLEWDWPTGMSAEVGQPDAAHSNEPKHGSDPAIRPLWLAVIGTAGHFPIKVLNAKEGKPDELALHSLDLGKPQFVPLLVWAVIAMLGLAHVLGLKYQKTMPSIFWHDFDFSDQASSVTLVKYFCHMMAILTVALSELILGSSYLFFYDSKWRYRTLACAVVVVTTILLVRAAMLLQRIYVLSDQQQKLSNPPEANQIIKPRRVLHSSLVLSFTMVGAGVVWLWMTMGNRFYNAFLHFRDLNLSSGVAPTLPLASLLLLLYCGIWAYMRRLSYWQHRYVNMFNLDLDPVIKQNFELDFRAIDACLLGPLENRRWVIAFGVVFAISVAAFRPLSTLDMIEPSRVAWFALFFFVLALMSLWVNWFRFLNIWFRLRSILDHLENLPIRTAFERLPRATTLPILQWSSSQSTFLLPQVLDRLRALVKADPSNLNRGLEADFEARISALTSPVVVSSVIAERRVVGGSPRTGPQPVPSRRFEDHLRDARHELTNLTVKLSQTLRAQYWNRGSSGDQKSQRPKPADQKYMLAEDIIALAFYAYIRKVMQELRNILFFLGVAISLLFAALHTYAFRADQAIDWWFFGLFAAMGLGIVVVIAQVERNALISRLSDRKPGELGGSFYLQLLKYGTVPILTIFGSQIPTISNVLLKWAQPALEALH